MRFNIRNIVVLFFLLIFGCSNAPKKPETLKKPEAPKILEVVKEVDGPLSGNLTVISKDAPIEIVQDKGNIIILFTVKLQVTNAIDLPGGYKDGSPFGPTLEYLLLDESKRPISIDGYRIQSDPNLDGISNNLNIGGNKFWIRIFQTISFSSESLPAVEELVKRAKYVQVTSLIQGNSNNTVSEETGNSTSNISESNNYNENKLNSESIIQEDSDNTLRDCDEFIEGYEKFMDDYIGILKKYSNDPTDMTILSEYTTTIAKVGEWSEKAVSIDECFKDEKFVKKYTDIQMKIANALTELQ